MKRDYPILEFDGSRDAIIEPSEIHRPVAGIPELCVLPIYHSVIEALIRKDLLADLRTVDTAMGPMSVYRMTHEGKDIVVANPRIGAPLAAALLETLIASGCRKFIACGSAGVLDSEIRRGTIVVPNAAVRDEGTSYHYASPSREIPAQQDVVQVIREVLEDRGVAYQVGKTWTTDAIFRETKARVAKRESEGCLTVEMECAAFLAVAAFRGVQFGQLLAASDDVSGNEWDPRAGSRDKSLPERLFWLSVEACIRL